MKKFIKHILFCGLVFSSLSVSAQLNDYLDAENIRIAQAQATEVAIASFIAANMDNYTLSKEKADEIILSLDQDDHEGTNHIVTEKELTDLLIEYKKAELRKLFFIQNPEKHTFFSAIEPSVSLQLACINGGFEQGNTNSYTFFSQVELPSIPLPFGCNVNVNANGFVPIGINNFQQRATIVNQGNEPLLANLSPPIIINRVNNVNGGNFSLKINPTPANPPGNTANDGEIGNITIVNSSPFIIDQNAIEFNFLLIGKVVPLNQHNQPTFRYMLVDANTNAVLRNVCITMNANDCRFNTVADTRPGWADPSFGLINYTPQWVCERINTSNLMGRNVRLIFQVSDCQRRGHFATVYIDNLCGVTCNPTWGTININPINIDCPTLPFQVCGNFQTPDLNTNVGNITMNILNQSGVQVGATLTNPVISSQNFCFNIDPVIFGANPSGNFTFQVNSTLINTTGCANPNILTSTNGSLSFNNCCQPTLTSAINPINTMVHEQRGSWIKSTDYVTFSDGVLGNGMVYHAGDFVELNPGFEAVQSSQFAAYIQGCVPDNPPTNPAYVYKNTDSTNQEAPAANSSLVKIAKELVIYPNPSNSSIDIAVTNDTFNAISISSIDGKIVFVRKFEGSTSTQIDVSRFAEGMYIVNVTSQTGKVYSKKLIKN